MFRRLLVLGVAVVIATVASVDLSACGDKFLRIGRSSRLNGYAAIHPSTILFFVPSTSKASAVKEFETTLRRAGHRFDAVTTIDALSDALKKGDVDIVIAGVNDAPMLRTHASVAPSKPEILPIVHEPSWAVRASIHEEYGHVLTLPATKHEALAEIDHVMESRLGSRAVHASLR
jgi:hypothetical protein